MTVGVVAVGRPTFDVELAQSLVDSAIEDLLWLAPDLVGSGQVRTTAEDVTAEVRAWPQPVHTIVVIFGTFTDSSLPWAAYEAAGGDPSVVLWAFPEAGSVTGKRCGERLRLNSLCGSNLASFRFGLADGSVSGVYGPPSDPRTQKQMQAALTDHTRRPLRTLSTNRGEPASPEVRRIASRVAEAKIGIIGRAPEGFEPCELIEAADQFGTTFDEVSLDSMFGVAESEDAVAVTIGRAGKQLAGINQLDQLGVERALRLHDGLRTLAGDRSWDAMAIRCWPECFTAWGGAPCAAMSFLTDAGLPAACEADAYGALTSLLLNEATGDPAFLADLVDLDHETDTAVFWHCGVAPLSMADPSTNPAAAVHPNRGVPLTVEFGLKPGPVTIARISQSRSQIRLVIGYGTVLPQPAPYQGTSGVVALDGSADDLFQTMIREGLEHHYCLVAGDHRQVLCALAEHWGIATINLNR